MNDQEYFESQRKEQERREDLSDERNFWAQIFMASFEASGNVERATKQADDALAIYKERFQ